MAVKPTLSDSLTALKMSLGKIEPDLRYDVNGDGVIDTTDVLGLQKAYLGKDPGFAFAGDYFSSPSTKTAADYAAENQAYQQRILAEQQETARRQNLLADAQKIYGNVTADLVANNPNLTAQQLASLATRNYWANESEAFARVSEGMKNGTAQLKQVVTGYDEGNQPIVKLAITTGDHPGYDTLFLDPTSQKGVYSFSTPNQVAGGMISGVISADPETGQYQPIQDFTKQVQYTPGTSGGFAGNLIGSIGDALKSMGPIPMVLGNAILPGAGSALGAVLALDEGNTKGALLSALASGGALGADAAKNALAAEVSGNADLANQYSSGIQGTLAENLPNIKTATSVAQLANSIDQGNLAGAANAVGNLTGEVNPTVNTGIAIAALAKSLSTGDFAQAAALSGQLTNDPDLKVASQAYKTLNALSNGDISQAVSQGVALSKIADSYLQPADTTQTAETPSAPSDSTSLSNLLPSQLTDYFNQPEAPTINVADTTPIFSPVETYTPPVEAYTPPVDNFYNTAPIFDATQFQPTPELPVDIYAGTPNFAPVETYPQEPPDDNSANANFVNTYTENDSSSLANLLPENLADNQTQDNQPQNLDFAGSIDSEPQAPETQPLTDAVVSQEDLQDNQPTTAQGTSMADILDSLGGFDSVDTSGDNIDAGGGWNPADNTDSTVIPDGGVDENGDPTYIDASGNPVTPDGTPIPAAAVSNITGGGTKLSSILKGLMPTTALGKAALGAGAGSVLQGLIGANASIRAAQLQSDAAKAALAQQQGMFNTLNQQQAPYRGAGYGALNQIQGMLPGQYTQYDAQGNPTGTATGTGYLTQQFTPETFQQNIDPGYAFRLQQGQMANQRLGNVGGGGLGGNVAKGLQDYTQGMASQEFGNAFNRFQTQRSNIYNTLAGIAGIGQTGQSQANTLGTNLANAQTNLGVGAAGAQAAGQVGQAGAYGGALGGINQALMLSQLPDIAAAMKG